ncbi:hypothetical protein SAMN05660657_05470 [Geodermatophilus amargosae]|uniref:Uncharacterized protein n=1 Tax=Geodermatophilus amargosae TaxID=1296565 RepID=A0A1I7D8H8_9ACTN|nr:hypothetical protein [Geodermatophilus amargosae]SFU08018.1 hypothetical protein SAMN05660657_05470 [Geodermatophilus amargosae]
MRELPLPGVPEECPRCGRTDSGLLIISGAGHDHAHLCPACLATVARAELAQPPHGLYDHDPRTPDPAGCAEAALWHAVGGTDPDAALTHGLAALDELNRAAARAGIELFEATEHNREQQAALDAARTELTRSAATVAQLQHDLAIARRWAAAMWWTCGTPWLQQHPELGPRPEWLRDDSADV